MERTIKIRAESADTIQKIIEECGREYFDAIGYLAHWAFPGDGNYDHANLFLSYSEHSGPEITARYLHLIQPDRVFIIGAVWNADTGKFSFHS